MPFFIWVLYFSIYSFLGWVLETIYCSAMQKRLVLRGFLVGPYCPIYGFGSIFVLALLSPFEHLPLLVFILAFLITSTLEYCVSFLLEKIFKKSWWNYSTRRFNLHGRIYLIYSIIWGLLCMFLIYALHPRLSDLLESISEQAVLVSATILVLLFIADIIYSVRDALRFNKEVIKLTHWVEKIEQLRTQMMTTAGETKLKAEKELNILLNQQEAYARRTFKKIRRILNAFPTIRFKRKDRLSIRERLNGYFNRR